MREESLESGNKQGPDVTGAKGTQISCTPDLMDDV
jgi:hypothetical protein